MVAKQLHQNDRVRYHRNDQILQVNSNLEQFLAKATKPSYHGLDPLDIFEHALCFKTTEHP